MPLQLTLFPDTKVCRACGEMKALSDFYASTVNRDGRGPYCKPCRKQRSREWELAHPERRRAYQQTRYQRNRESERAARRAHYVRTRPVRIAKATAWNRENPERRATTIQSYSRRRQARLAASTEHFTEVQWAKLLHAYGYQCVACGSQEQLGPDHVVPVSKGGSDAITNIQPLCWPCNQRKMTDATDYRPFPVPSDLT